MNLETHAYNGRVDRHICWPRMEKNIKGLGFDHICRTPLREVCLKHHGHNGDPIMTLGTCGAVGERAQVIIVWVRVLSVGNASHPSASRPNSQKY